MGTAVRSPTSAELFYSYAHSDESLCKELQKHLTALKRSGLIHDWYDRRIEPGSEWGAQIQEAMERASIILLLVSADFLASKYIFEVEIPFALQRHDSGRAKVIPVLLRPVEWRDLPLAKLQVLPSEARAVTLWPNQDEAFSDIAGRLRELLYGERLREVTLANRPRQTPVTQERVLDAAIASSVVTDEPTDLVTMVRTTESGGLKAILQIDRTYSPTDEDVQSKTFELDFPSDPFGRIRPATLELVLESPGFNPPTQRKNIRVPSAGDSDVSVFMLTPTRPGTLRLNLQVLSADVEIGSRALVTRSVAAGVAQPILSYGVTSLLLKAPVDQPSDKAVPAARVSPREPGEYTHFFESNLPPKSGTPAARSPFPSTATDRDPCGPVALPDAPRIPLAATPPVSKGPSEYTKVMRGSNPRETSDPRTEAGRPPGPVGVPLSYAPPPPPELAKKRSRRGVWIGILSSAAAVAIVSTVLIQNGNNTSRAPAPETHRLLAGSARTTGSSGIVALSEAIKRNPNGTELYLQRAEQYQRDGKTGEALIDAERATELAPNNVNAHFLYGQLLEKADLKDQALREYKKVQSLKPAPSVLKTATQRVGQLQRELSAPNR